MNLPENLERKIEEEVSKYKLSNLKEYSQGLSNKYMKETRTGKALLSLEEEAVAYSVMRMPATFCAITNILQNCDIKIDSLLDVGAGTGAASFAVTRLFDVQKVTCLEREKAMMKLGKKLMADEEILSKAEWIDIDVLKDDINVKADLVIVSYMVNELKEEDKKVLLEKLIKCTNKYLLIVEPGTPEGFLNIRNIRDNILEDNLNILAPCATYGKCEIPKGDWCSFSVRVQRTKIHKILKSGDVPYEDEKYSYILISKEKVENTSARILRHPAIKPKMIGLKLCTKDGIKEIVITKKNGEVYKEAKKKKVGDSIEYGKVSYE